MLPVDSKMPHLRCMESLQPHQAAEATAAWLLHVVEQHSLSSAARKATDMFLSGLLMQIIVMENSFMWLKVNLSSLHSAVVLCVKELTVSMVI